LPDKTTSKMDNSKPSMYLHYAGLTNTGMMRSHNEDAYKLPNVGPDTLTEKGYFYVLADGMGGHKKGEVASAVTVETTNAEYYATVASQEGKKLKDAIIEAMALAIEKANRQVIEATDGGGTTIVATVLLDDLLVVMNVGDSRAYLLRDDELRLVSRDHSLVHRLREMGKITQEEALNHPRQNVLYQALGQGSDLEIHVFTEKLKLGDVIILCSDGLWGSVGDAAIKKVVSSMASPREAAGELIDMANAAGGPDNITTIIIRVSDEAPFEDGSIPEPEAAEASPDPDDTQPSPTIKDPQPEWRSIKWGWFIASLIIITAIGAIVYYSAL
jgi:serine/threonine protein phosphatase PrpC